MLTKEECVNALKELSFALDNFNILDKPSLWECISLGAVGLERLIKEHFNPRPYKFEELKEGMWVWDNHNKKCVRVYDMVKKKDWFLCVTEHTTLVTWYEENRFFPVQMANVRCE